MNDGSFQLIIKKTPNLVPSTSVFPPFGDFSNFPVRLIEYYDELTGSRKYWFRKGKCSLILYVLIYPLFNSKTIKVPMI